MWTCFARQGGTAIANNVIYRIASKHIFLYREENTSCKGRFPRAPGLGVPLNHSS